MLPKAAYANCGNCPLRNQPLVPTYEPDTVTLAVVGEAPGSVEVAKKEPFVGPSGRLLNTLAGKADIDPTTIFKTNAVLCRPPNNRTPSGEALACCAPRLLHDLNVLPKDVAIMALGKTASDAIQALDNRIDSSTIGARRGNWIECKVLNRPFITSWHPAYILRRHSAAPDLGQDMLAAVKGAPVNRFPNPPEVHIPRDHVELEAMLSTCPKTADVAFDIETSNLRWYDQRRAKKDFIIMVVFAWQYDKGIAVPHKLLHDSTCQRILNNFFASDRNFIAHNGKFDEVFLRAQIGLEIRVDDDSMLAHYALNELKGTHGLKQLAMEHFHIDDYEKKLVTPYLKNRNDDYSKVPFDKFSLYAIWDVVVTLALMREFRQQLQKDGLHEWPYKNVLMRMHRMLVQVELNGIHVDAKYLTEQRQFFEHEMRVAAQKMQDIAGWKVNPRSFKQLAEVMYDQLQLPMPRGRGIKPRSTNKEVLDKLKGKHEFVDTLAHYRRVHKITSSYVDNILDRLSPQNRVHATFNIHGTEIGRLSVRDPALQTIPRASDVYGAIIRSAFIARPGFKFVQVDYSQAELRVLGALSMEQFLIDVYNNDRDLHSEVAKAMYGNYTKEQRNLCKMFNFSYAYGGTEHSFDGTVGLNKQMAREFVRKYDANMPRAAEWKREQLQKALTNGYVETIFGRRRRFPVISSQTREDIRKSSIHMPVASVASDFTSLAACNCVRAGVMVVLLVHDSILAEVPENEADDVTAFIADEMTSVAMQYLPQIKWKVDGDVGDRWIPIPAAAVRTDAVSAGAL